LIAAGLLAALVIILSHSYSLRLQEEKKATTERSDDSTESRTVLTAPAEALTQGSIVRVDEQVPVSVIEILGEPQKIQSFVPRSEVIFSNLFKTLFRVLIAPNAP
jgi:hypothetical protein